MPEIKDRRKALGWTRAELCQRGNIDPRTMQLIELGLSEDTESRQRAEAALEAGERAAGLRRAGDDEAS